MSFSILGYKIYNEDKTLRNLFLLQQNSNEVNFLLDKLIPINVIITKYDVK